MPLSLPKDCVRETEVIDISSLSGSLDRRYSQSDRDISQAGQLLLNSGNRPGAVTASVVPSSA
jgi:hypothetical protein